MIKKEHKGQVALVMVLIMTVVSTLAVSLASRSTVDTKIQQSESEGVQALLFAQTGLEQLIMDPSGSTAGQMGADYYAEKSDIGKSSVDLGSMDIGSTVEINLQPANAALTSFIVYWGPDNDNPGNKPAVFISVITSSGNITDYAYDYDGLNGFVVATDGSGGYAKKTPNIALNTDVVKVRISVLGSPALLRILPVGAEFPSQIKSIKSTGSVQSGDKTVKYGLQYDESAADSIPSVFDYALFSGGSIVQ